MSRVADGTNYAYASFDSSWWGGSDGYVTLTFWLNENGSGWNQFDDWVTIGGGGAPSDSTSMTVYQKNSAQQILGDYNGAGANTIVAVDTTQADDTWIMIHARCYVGHDGLSSLTPQAHIVGIPAESVEAGNDNALGLWTNNSETSIRYVGIMAALNGGAKQADGLLSSYAVWKGHLSSSDLVSLYSTKTHPSDISPANATLKAYFLDEHAHGTGTEEYTDSVGGSVSLVEQGAGSLAYNSSEPGISAPAGGGGGGGNVWAPNTGIITDMSGFRGNIR